MRQIAGPSCRAPGVVAVQNLPIRGAECHPGMDLVAATVVDGFVAGAPLRRIGFSQEFAEIALRARG